jgi:hypothetical protein
MATRGLSRSGAQRRHEALEPVCHFDRNGRSCSHPVTAVPVSARQDEPDPIFLAIVDEALARVGEVYLLRYWEPP